MCCSNELGVNSNGHAMQGAYAGELVAIPIRQRVPEAVHPVEHAPAAQPMRTRAPLYTHPSESHPTPPPTSART